MKSRKKMKKRRKKMKDGRKKMKKTIMLRIVTDLTESKKLNSNKAYWKNSFWMMTVITEKS